MLFILSLTCRKEAEEAKEEKEAKDIFAIPTLVYYCTPYG